MPVFQIDSLEAGMILKSAVCDRSGRVLLPAGAELIDKHLKIFRTWGISEADVEGDDTNEESSEMEVESTADPAALARARQEIEELFMLNDHKHPLISELMRICVALKVKHAV